MGKKVLAKKEAKNDLLQKIIKGRLAETQELGWLFRPLALCPLPAQPLPKIEVKRGDKVETEHDTYWSRKSGKFKIEIIGHKDYGIPHGQDILIILYLAIEAKRQNSRFIEVNFYRDFMRMFGMDANSGRKYQLVKDSVYRIKESKFSWKDVSVPENRQKGGGFLYIDDYDLYFDPKKPDQPSLFNQFILLSERFWFEINAFEIPFNLDAVRFLKGKPAHLNFYIWLSFRVWYCYKNEGGRVSIPYWGENGLQQQMSSRIKARRDYRIQVKKWLNSVKKVWPECPCQIQGDALRINVSKTDQLDIQEKPSQRFLEFPAKAAERPELPPADEAARNYDKNKSKYEKEYRYYGAKGKKLKEALSQSPEQVERNLVHFKVLIESMRNSGEEIKNPGAFLCDCTIKDYSRKSPHQQEEAEEKKRQTAENERRGKAVDLFREKKQEFDDLLNKKVMKKFEKLSKKKQDELRTLYLESSNETIKKHYQAIGLENLKEQSGFTYFLVWETGLIEGEKDFEKYIDRLGYRTEYDGISGNMLFKKEGPGPIASG
jgi:hypothetical protein